MRPSWSSKYVHISYMAPAAGDPKTANATRFHFVVWVSIGELEHLLFPMRSTQTYRCYRSMHIDSLFTVAASFLWSQFLQRRLVGWSGTSWLLCDPCLSRRIQRAKRFQVFGAQKIHPQRVSKLVHISSCTLTIRTHTSAQWNSKSRPRKFNLGHPPTTASTKQHRHRGSLSLQKGGNCCISAGSHPLSPLPYGPHATAWDRLSIQAHFAGSLAYQPTKIAQESAKMLEVRRTAMAPFFAVDFADNMVGDVMTLGM